MTGVVRSRVTLAVVLILFGALGGLKILSDRIRRRATTDYSPVGDFVAVDGARLQYVRSGEGRPVVMLHASGLVLQDFTLSIFDEVAATDQAIALDRPGYGYSERPAGAPLTLALNARLIHDALRQLNVDRPVLVGHSSGASVALCYALDHPDGVAGLVLIAPSAYGEDVSAPPLSRLTETPILGPLFLNIVLAPLARIATPLFEAGLFSPGSPPAAHVEAITAFAVRPDHFRAHAEELKHLAGGLREQSPRYGEIQAPVVIVAGEADQVDRPESQSQPLHRTLPNSRLVMLPETGHAAHHAHSEVVIDAIRQMTTREAS